MGRFKHWEGDALCRSCFHERAPGIWYCTINNGYDFSITGGFYTPLVWYYSRKGYRIEFHEAYVWDQHAAILRQWAERLYKVREALHDDPVARRTAKDFYTQALGWLRMREEYNRDTHDHLFRPDWHGMIEEHAFCLIRYKLDNLLRDGYECVWCNKDEIGFLSDDPNAETAVPGLINNTSRMGGFHEKYAGPILVDSTVRKALGNETSYSQCMQILGRAGRAVTECEIGE